MLGKICVCANIVVALWGFLVPAFYQPCMLLLIVLPCLSLLAMLFDSHFRGGFFTVIAPVLALIERLATDTGEPGRATRMNTPMLHWVYVVAGSFVLVFLLADRLKVWKKGVGSIILLLSCLGLFALSYAIGVVDFANMYLDHSTRHIAVPIQSAEREVWQGYRSSHTSYWITVDPPGKVREWPLPLVYSVGWENFQLLKRDSQLCIDAGEGRFGYRWYRVLVSCP